MKTWAKDFDINKSLEEFTVGKDQELDMLIAEYDILGSLAHAKMLENVRLINKDELNSLLKELRAIYHKIRHNNFKIEQGVEDIHSQIEIILTEKLGNTGKKIHTGRSRNDQILLDIRLFSRNELMRIAESVQALFKIFIELSERHKDVLIPGYTHLQVAMPSSFGLWFGAFAESLVDDMVLIEAAYRINNQNPLGTAAGYGTSLPLNRQLTTELLGFDSLIYNSAYAQISRGKTEKIIAFAYASVASTLSKFAMDACLYMNQNFAFISLPDEFTNGSSIMPHKKNPDVFELIRSKCNKIQALPNEIAMLVVNLPSGYHRDFQTIKENFLPVSETLNSCLNMTEMILKNIIINKDVINDEKYKFIFSVDAVNKKVMEGESFRDAYKQVSLSISEGTFKHGSTTESSNEGSINNLCNNKINEKMQNVYLKLNFAKSESAIKNLLLEDDKSE